MSAAKSKVSSNNSQPSSEASFKPFSWHWEPDYTTTEKLVEDVVDIGNGIQIALQLIEASGLETEKGNAPLLDPNHCSTLLRFAMASSGLLVNAAEQNIAWSNDQKRKAKKSLTPQGKNRPVQNDKNAPGKR